MLEEYFRAFDVFVAILALPSLNFGAIVGRLKSKLLNL
jgi:hypothetical protein